MGLKRKQMLMEQKAFFELKLKDRLSFLSGKGVKSPEADKDTLVRKLKADIRVVNRRLRVIADNEKRTEEIAKIKAGKAAEAAIPKKEQEGGKGEKPKKAPEEGKGKKMKAEMKAAAQKAPEGGKSQKPAESGEEAKAATKKKEEET